MIIKIKNQKGILSGFQYIKIKVLSKSLFDIS